MITYFPNLLFGWTYFLLLIALLGVASYLDMRFMKIPKWLTLVTCGVGLLANLIRGAWMGFEGQTTWVLEPGGLAVGLADGLLFSLVGFFVGFFLFFILWILGVSGGGDVKLFTALGTWIGPVLTLEVFMATVVVVAFVVIFRLARLMFSGKGFQVMHDKARKQKADKKKPKKGDLGFSLPVAIASVLVLLWAYRADLRLSQPKIPGNEELKDARVELTNSR